MKKKRSLCAALLAGLMVTAVCLTGCGKKADDNAGGGSSDPDKVYQVGVCQLTQHDALDAATQGFVDALNTILGSEHVNIDVQVASGDSTTCTPIVNSFVNKKVDLIMANATPALQAAYNATTSIPILGTSVTEYGVALGLSDFSGTVGGNISGTSDLAPLTEQADMILELVPQAKTVGLLYCSAEPNSEYQVKVVEDYLSGKGITCTRYSFSDSNDVAAVTTKAAASTSARAVSKRSMFLLLSATSCFYQSITGILCQVCYHIASIRPLHGRETGLLARTYSATSSGISTLPRHNTGHVRSAS